MKIDNFHNSIIKTVQERFIADGNVPGTLFALTPNNTIIVCCKPWDDEKEKIHTYNMYSVILAVKQVSLYSFTSEMWFAKEKPGPFTLPSQQSDRKEGILIATRDKQNSIFEAFEIIRPENQLKNLNFGDNFEDHINLFDRVDPSKAINLDMEQAAKGFDKIPKPEWYMEIRADEL